MKYHAINKSAITVNNTVCS